MRLVKSRRFEENVGKDSLPKKLLHGNMEERRRPRNTKEGMETEFGKGLKD